MSHFAARDHGCRISDAWIYRGMRTIVIENDLLRVTVLVDRGSDIVEFRYKPQDLNFLHLAPSGIRNPTQEIAPAASDSPYLDYFSGGWNEILPNGGPSVEYKGAVLGQHGEICLIPWQYAILDDTPEHVSVQLWVRPLRTPFFLVKTLSMRPGQAVLQIEETLRNEAGEPMHLMWGHHIAFGRPFLDDGVHIDAPARRFITHEDTPVFDPRRFKPDTASAWPQAQTIDGKQGDASINSTLWRRSGSRKRLRRNF